MDNFSFGSPPTKTEDAMGDIPFSSFDDDLDHRKRRRNRTTQSCWSCHQAKRKCDRKRPCSRCIQLGLTGLCVYETDDPASRDDPSLTEAQRLRKRIAELEALVREMKNKPHPRWADKVSQGNIGVDKWHTRAKYVAGSSTSPTSGAGIDAFDEYQYRFPPLDGGNGYDGSFSSSGTVLPPFDDSRRLSIASSVSSTSSPRTPYSYHGHGVGITSNPCGCLTSSPTTSRALAHAIRSVVLDSGITHPFSEGCKVLALVRELENAADSSSSSSTAHSQHHHQHPHYSYEPHSNTGSPHPSSSTSAGSGSPPNALPHPLPQLPQLPHPLHPPSVPSQSHSHSRTHLSYASYSAMNGISYTGSYASPSNEDQVPSYADYATASVEYGSPSGPSPSKSYPLTVV